MLLGGVTTLPVFSQNPIPSSLRLHQTYTMKHNGKTYLNLSQLARHFDMTGAALAKRMTALGIRTPDKTPNPTYEHLTIERLVQDRFGGGTEPVLSYLWEKEATLALLTQLGVREKTDEEKIKKPTRKQAETFLEDAILAIVTHLSYKPTIYVGAEMIQDNQIPLASKKAVAAQVNKLSRLRMAVKYEIDTWSFWDDILASCTKIELKLAENDKEALEKINAHLQMVRIMISKMRPMRWHHRDLLEGHPIPDGEEYEEIYILDLRAPEDIGETLPEIPAYLPVPKKKLELSPSRIDAVCRLKLTLPNLPDDTLIDTKDGAVPHPVVELNSAIEYLLSVAESTIS